MQHRAELPLHRPSSWLPYSSDTLTSLYSRKTDIPLGAGLHVLPCVGAAVKRIPRQKCDAWPREWGSSNPCLWGNNKTIKHFHHGHREIMLFWQRCLLPLAWDKAAVMSHSKRLTIGQKRIVKSLLSLSVTTLAPFFLSLFTNFLWDWRVSPAVSTKILTLKDRKQQSGSYTLWCLGYCGAKHCHFIVPVWRIWLGRSSTLRP